MSEWTLEYNKLPPLYVPILIKIGAGGCPFVGQMYECDGVWRFGRFDYRGVGKYLHDWTKLTPVRSGSIYWQEIAE